MRNDTLIEIPRSRQSQSKPSDLARTRRPRGEPIAKVTAQGGWISRLSRTPEQRRTCPRAPTIQESIRRGAGGLRVLTPPSAPARGTSAWRDRGSPVARTRPSALRDIRGSKGTGIILIHEIHRPPLVPAAVQVPYVSACTKPARAGSPASRDARCRWRANRGPNSPVRNDTLIEIPRPRPSQSKPSDLARTRRPRASRAHPHRELPCARWHLAPGP